MHSAIRHTEELIELLTKVKTELADEIETLARKMSETLKTGGKIVTMGNGGSAADAQHIAAEFVGRYKLNRRAMPALALNVNTSAITAIGNDFGYDEVFARQIEAFAQQGDLVLAISTSGNSANIIKAVTAARARQCYIAGLLGGSGGKLKELVDLPIVIPSGNTPRIQECHIHIAHIACEIAERENAS
ncbi:MAG: SIS domain-containing protein [Elusimicrobiaceae bacterium]|nr:SIS domain-containing protein [Elusimicrobiaceae bacterium]